MVRPDNLSDYVEKMSAKLQDGNRRGQTLLLLREIADLRLQVQTLSTAIAALTSYQEIAPLLQPPAEQSTLILPRRAHLDASQHLQVLDGFYALEYTQSGVPYRWTGPQLRFRFGVWIDRSEPVDVTLSVIFCGNPGNVLNTHLFIDEVRYPVRFDEMQNLFIVEGILPRSFRGLSLFEFELAGHFEDKDSSELRDLGVPFRSFEARCRDGAADMTAHG
jgi:hypothetical protein